MIYVTRNQAAEILGVSPKTVTNYIEAGKFEGAFRLGRAWAIPKDRVKALAKVLPRGGNKRGRKKRG